MTGGAGVAGLAGVAGAAGDVGGMGVGAVGEMGVIGVAGVGSTAGGTLATVTSNDVELVLPDESVAVQVTVVVPTGNTEPEAGRQATCVVPELSVAVGAG